MQSFEVGQQVRKLQFEITHWITDLFHEKYPQIFEQNEGLMREKCHNDMGYHLEALTGALECGSVDAFSEYARWLKELLNNKGIKIDHALLAFRFMDEFYKNHLSKDAYPLINSMLQAGIESLQDDTLYRGAWR